MMMDGLWVGGGWIHGQIRLELHIKCLELLQTPAPPELYLSPPDQQISAPQEDKILTQIKAPVMTVTLIITAT
jgi:hypothetical protein